MSLLFAFGQRRGLAVPRVGYRSYETGSIHGWSVFDIYRVAADLEGRNFTWQSPLKLSNFLSLHQSVKFLYTSKITLCKYIKIIKKKIETHKTRKTFA